MVCGSDVFEQNLRKKMSLMSIRTNVNGFNNQAAEIVGSLIGMENCIDEYVSYDATKLVAFPPLWISTGAKILRQHEAELNWKDRMQDWETEKPERPSIYKIAIKDNLLKLRKKCYGCTDHGLRTNCIG